MPYRNVPVSLHIFSPGRIQLECHPGSHRDSGLASPPRSIIGTVSPLPNTGNLTDRAPAQWFDGGSHRVQYDDRPQSRLKVRRRSSCRLPGCGSHRGWGSNHWYRGKIFLVSGSSARDTNILHEHPPDRDCIHSRCTGVSNFFYDMRELY